MLSPWNYLLKKKVIIVQEKAFNAFFYEKC